MDYEVAGLPLHVLLVHAMVVLTPLLAALLVTLAAWPGARRVLAVPALLGAAGLLALGLVTIDAGKWLEARLPLAPLIQEHTAQGEDLVPWLVGLLVAATVIAIWAVLERVDARRAAHRLGRGVRLGVGVLLTAATLVVAIGSTVTLVRIGEAGSRAVWEGSFSDEPLER